MTKPAKKIEGNIKIGRCGFRGFGTYAIIQDGRDTGKRIEIREMDDVDAATGDAILKVS